MTWIIIPIAIFLVAFAFLIYRNGYKWLRHVLIYLSHASWARDLVTRMALARRVSRRFVAGETVDEAMRAAADLNRNGMMVTLDFLGESVTDKEIARTSTEEILYLLDRIEETGVDANVSVKLSQLGLRIEEEFALENMQRILNRASEHDNKIRIDMEESDVVDTTLAVYRKLRDDYGFKNVGIVIQSYLYRSLEDVSRLIEEGAWVRLCKGAYAEPPTVAFPDKADTDRNFVNLTEMMLSRKARENGVYLAIATHDHAMIEASLDYVKANDIPSEEFEFQMLYGIQRRLQTQLVDEGYQVRIYVPYGTAWYPYLVRRLAEHPANFWFFVSNLFRR